MILKFSNKSQGFDVPKGALFETQAVDALSDACFSYPA